MIIKASESGRQKMNWWDQWKWFKRQNKAYYEIDLVFGTTSFYIEMNRIFLVKDSRRLGYFYTRRNWIEKL